MLSAEKRAKRRGQSLVEFTLVAPLLFLIMFVTIDFARLVYAYNAISSAAREGTRILALRSEIQSDCLALQAVQNIGQGFVLTQDPGSLYGNGNPNNPGGAQYAPSTPPAGRGYIYIWPAVATPSSCNNPSQTRPYPPTGPGQLKEVSVQVQYSYQPMISLISSFVPPFTIKAISGVKTEY